ncbi:MAG: hypothetical protein ACSHX8_09435 [Opitutaceae bacterium]
MKHIFRSLKLSCLVISLFFVQQLSARIVADFEQDFIVSTDKSGWRYFWNPEGVRLGDRGLYVELQALPSGGRYIVDVENRPSPSNTLPNAQWLRVSRGDIAPGDPRLKSTDDQDHYVILSYTIQEGEAGIGGIVGSRIERKQEAESGKLCIYVNDKLIGSDEVVGTAASRFNVPLGPLHVGDTIYVAFGPGGVRAVGAMIQFQIDIE